jgi:hypothetical protein
MASQVGGALSNLVGVMDSLGVASDDTGRALVSGLAAGAGGFAQMKSAANDTERAIIAANAAMSIVSSNSRNMSGGNAAMSGAAQGAAMGASVGGGYGAIIGAIAGGVAGYFSGQGFRNNAHTAATVLGGEVSAELANAIQDTIETTSYDAATASLLHLGDALTESARGARGFGRAGVDLVTSVRTGAIGAADGVEALGDAFDAFAADAERSGGLASQNMVDMMNAARAMGQEIPGMEDWTDKWLGQAAEAMSGITGALDNGKLAGGITIASPEQAAASATIFSTTFWAVVKEQGILAAAEAMGPAYDALMQQLEAAVGPEMAATLMGGVGALMGSLTPEVEAALTAVESLNTAFEGIANAGYMTQSAFDAFGTSAQSAFDQAVAGGLSSEQAYQAIGPLLANILRAHEEYGVAIDADTQALIDQARAAGVAFPTDPIYAMVDAVHELINAIRVANGLPPINWASQAASAAEGATPGGRRPPASDPDSGGDAPAPSSTDGFAEGGIAYGPTSGHWELLHGTEMVTPLNGPLPGYQPPRGDTMARDLDSALQDIRSAPASPVIAPNISIAIDPLGLDQIRSDLMLQIQEAVSVGVEKGTSPVMRSFEERYPRLTGRR